MQTHLFPTTTRFRATVILLAALSATSAAQAFEVSSPALKEGDRLTQRQLYNGFGCTGENRSPALAWSEVPVGTQSFGVTLYDPDAPTGSGWWHWVVFNIPAQIRSLPEDAGNADGVKLPQGAVQSRTDFGSVGFGGACPPVGDKPHRYQLTVYALDTTEIALDASSTAAMVGFFLNQHAIAKAQITWNYGRE